MEKKERKRPGGVWQDPDSGIWRYRFMHKGQRYFGTAPNARNKTEAKVERDRRQSAVREGREDKAEVETNFRLFVLETFLPWVEMNLSPATYKGYKWRAGDLIEAFGALNLSQVSVIAIERFKREQMKRKTNRGEIQSPASVNHYLLVLGSIFTRAEELGAIERGKRPKIACLRVANHRLRYLTPDEEQRLLAAAAHWPHLQDLIVVGLATGLRRDELFSLTKADVDPILNLVTVRDGKGGKMRTVPLDPEGEALQVLCRLKAESRSDWLFTSPKSGGKLTSVDRSLATACELAEIEPAITMHVLRHTFCTRLASAKVDLRTIQELAGHSDISTTMRYVHLVESNRHEAIRSLTHYHEITTGEVVELSKKAG